MMKNKGLLILLLLWGCGTPVNVGQDVQITIDRELLEDLGREAEDTEDTAQQVDIPLQVKPTGIDMQRQVIIQPVYDMANGLNQPNFEVFQQAFHPESAFFQNGEAGFNELVKLGVTHLIDRIQVESVVGDRATVRVLRTSPAFGSNSRSDELLYQMQTFEGAWKLLQIDKVDSNDLMFSAFKRENQNQ